MHVRWTLLWIWSGSFTDSDFAACLDTRRVGFFTYGNVDERGVQLAFKDVRNNGVRYLVDGVPCAVRGGKIDYIFEANTGVHGTIDEGQ